MTVVINATRQVVELWAGGPTELVIDASSVGLGGGGSGGGSVNLSDATPHALGTAAPGTSSAASRGDHVHKLPTTADIHAEPEGSASTAVVVHNSDPDAHGNIDDKIAAVVMQGTGAPQDVVAAPVGTVYERTNGFSGSTLYVKETGGSTANGWRGLRNTYYDERDYGGFTDAGLQAAIDSIAGAGGGVLILPATNTFSISQPVYLKEKVYVRGNGWGTILQVAAGADITGHVIGVAAGTVTPQFCGVMDLSIDGNKNNQTTGTCHGLEINSNASPGSGEFFDKHHIFRGIRIYKANGDGVHLAGRSGCVLEAILADQSRDFGFYSTFDTMFTDCQAASSGKHGFEIHNGSVQLTACKSYLNGRATFSTPWDTTAVGFHITGNVAGVGLTNCYAQNNSAQGFLVDSGARVSAAGCIADGNGYGLVQQVTTSFANPTGDTHSSTTIDNVSISAPTASVVGWTITGTGIPASTTVSAWTGTTITLSQAATATAAGISLTINHPPHTCGLTIDGSSNGIYGVVCVQSTQGGVQVGYQTHALECVNGADQNTILASHSTISPATIGATTSPSHTALANNITINGVGNSSGYTPGGTDVAVADGGTGSSTAAGARTNLGLVIGTDVQAQDPELAALAGLTSAADRLPYFNGSGTAALTTFTTAGRALVDDTDATAQRTTLGLGTIATQSSTSVTITGGTITGITDLTIGDGGTGASDAATARTNLGLAVGTDVQGHDIELDALAGLTSAADRLPYFTGSGTASLATFTTAGRNLVDDADTTAQRTTLGLGSIATQASSSVTITGGSITGITDLPVADGGTGASDAATAATNLAVVPATGWIPESGPTYTSGTGTRIVVFAVTTDATTRMTEGWRIKFTNSTVKYGIIVKVAATSITVVLASGVTYSGTSDPTSVSISPMKVPVGFDADPATWTISFTDTSDRTTASPNALLFYNPSDALTLSVPPGAWKLAHSGILQGTSAAAVAQAAFSTVDVSSVFGTASGGTAGANSSGTIEAVGNTRNMEQIKVSDTTATNTHQSQSLWFVRQVVNVKLTSTTSYYINVIHRTSGGLSVGFRGDLLTTRIDAECGYL